MAQSVSRGASAPRADLRASTPTTLDSLAHLPCAALDDMALSALADHCGIVVLKPVDSATRHARFFSLRESVALEIEDAMMNGTTLYKRYARPDGLQNWHPAHWTGSTYLTDTRGQRWTHVAGTYVMDDFGTLVQLNGGAA